MRNNRLGRSGGQKRSSLADPASKMTQPPSPTKLRLAWSCASTSGPTAVSAKSTFLMPAQSKGSPICPPCGNGTPAGTTDRPTLQDTTSIYLPH